MGVLTLTLYRHEMEIINILWERTIANYPLPEFRQPLP